MKQHRLFIRAFSLIELLVVIVVISIIIAGYLSVATRGKNEAERAKAREQLNAVAAAIYAFEADWGIYPPHLGYLYNTQLLRQYAANKGVVLVEATQYFEHTPSINEVRMKDDGTLFYPEELGANFGIKAQSFDYAIFLYDIWGNPFYYNPTGKDDTFFLMSSGPDGVAEHDIVTFMQDIDFKAETDYNANAVNNIDNSIYEN